MPPRSIDISMPLRTGMPAFPGDPAVRFERVRAIARGDAYNISSMAMGTHTGTHVDPPIHFVPGGRTADALDLDILNGPCRVVDVGGADRIGPGELAGRLDGVTRLLLRTRNSTRWARDGAFFSDYVALTPEAASALPAPVRLVGIDALSIERDTSGSFPVHHQLLGRGTLILEGLLLGDAAPGEYVLRCLPLRIEDGDGAPVRALLDPA